jgi:hypothetical protein
MGCDFEKQIQTKEERTFAYLTSLKSLLHLGLITEDQFLNDNKRGVLFDLICLNNTTFSEKISLLFNHIQTWIEKTSPIEYCIGRLPIKSKKNTILDPTNFKTFDYSKLNLQEKYNTKYKKIQYSAIVFLGIVTETSSKVSDKSCEDYTFALETALSNLFKYQKNDNRATLNKHIKNYKSSQGGYAIFIAFKSDNNIFA